MRSPLLIIVDMRRLAVQALCGSALVFAAAALNAQSLAVLTPNETAFDKSIAVNLRTTFANNFRVQDLDMSEAAFASFHAVEPFNMTSDDARRLGSVLGCDFFILVRGGTQRRAAIEKTDYFEAFAAFFVVSSRTGRLIAWKLASEKGSDEQNAQRGLVNSLSVPELHDQIILASKNEASESQPPALEEPPEPNTPAAKDYRPPVPYRRLKPEYTRTAYLYDITATVDIVVDLDDKGSVLRTEISRWAGYGLHR
jgi:hypothetical protein